MAPFGWINEATKYIHDWITYQKLIDSITPGYSVCIAHKGSVILEQGFGFSDLEKKSSMTEQNLFRVASHSKNFTAVAIMQLVESGKICLEDFVSWHLEFLKNNPDKRVHRITIQQLLNHRAGVYRDGASPSFWRLQRPFPTLADLVSAYEAEALIIDSDTRFKYSNYAYALLGLLIEEISDLSYQEYMERYIFKVIGLESTGTDYNPVMQSYVTGYSNIMPDGSQFPIPSSIEANYYKGAIGFYSTAKDLCSFYSALILEKEILISNETKYNMLLNSKYEVPDINSAYSYAYGFASETIEGFKLFGHSGGFPGQTTKSLFHLNDGIVVSVLTNSYCARAENLQKGIWSILSFFKENYSPSSISENIGGFYYDMAGVIGITPMGEKVYVSNPSQVEPFKVVSELERSDKAFKITKENGFGSYGEMVEFITENEEVRFVNYAGYPKYRHQINQIPEERIGN